MKLLGRVTCIGMRYLANAQIAREKSIPSERDRFVLLKKVDSTVEQHFSMRHVVLLK